MQVFSHFILGITALLIAAKTEEIYPPNLDNFVYVCDNAYSKANIIEMEAQMLLSAEFCLVISSSLQLLQLFAEQLFLSEEELYLAKYFLEYSLSRYSLSGKKNTLLAAAAVSLTLSFFRHSTELIDNFIISNNWEGAEVSQCSWLMWEAAMEAKRTQQFTSIERKYSVASCYRVSLLNTHVLAMDQSPCQ